MFAFCQGQVPNKNITIYKFTPVDTTCTYTSVYISRATSYINFDSLIKTWKRPKDNVSCKFYPIRIVGAAEIKDGKLIVTDSLKAIQQMIIALHSLNLTP